MTEYDREITDQIKGFRKRLLKLVHEGHESKICEFLNETIIDEGVRYAVVNNVSHAPELRQLPFHAATKTGKVKVMEAVLPDDPHVLDGRGYSALHLAAANGRVDAAWWLIEEQLSDVNLRHNLNGKTALHLAVSFGHTDVIDLLIRKGASVTTLDNAKMMPVSYCKGSEMFSALVSALRERIFDADLFLDNGKFVRDDESKTWLHYAAIYSQDIRFLVHLIFVSEQCSDNLPVSEQETSFLHEAARVGNMAVLKALQDADQLFLDSGTMKTLLCGPNRQAEISHNPGHAVGSGTVIQNPAGTATNNSLRRSTPSSLGQAAANGGQSVDGEGSSTSCYYSPAYEALFNNRRTFFNEILRMGSSFGLQITLNNVMEKLKQDSKIKNGLEESTVDMFAKELPTYLALYAEKTDLFDLLLESGVVTVNQWDNSFKRTCLHWAVLHKKPDIVRKLVSKELTASSAPAVTTDVVMHRPSPSIKDGNGKTAYQIAFEQHNEEMMEIMRESSVFREREDKLYKDREVYVQGLNAILVGAALIASVTFAGWLQLPSHLFTDFSMQLFSATNTISFFLAVAVMCITIGALVPTPNKYVGDIRDQLRLAVVINAFLLAFSLAAATWAFSSAAFAAFHSNARPITHILLPLIIALLAVGCLVSFAVFLVQLVLCVPSVDEVLQILMSPPTFIPDCALRYSCSKLGERSRKHYTSHQKSRHQLTLCGDLVNKRNSQRHYDEMETSQLLLE